MSAPPSPGGKSLLGMGALNVGGHKIPYALVGAAAGVAGLFFLIRAHNSGAGVGAGSVPSTDLSAQGVAGQDYSAALANLSQQLGDLQSSLPGSTTGTAAGTTPTTAPDPPGRTRPSLEGPPGNPGHFHWSIPGASAGSPLAGPPVPGPGEWGTLVKTNPL